MSRMPSASCGVRPVQLQSGRKAAATAFSTNQTTSDVRPIANACRIGASIARTPANPPPANHPPPPPPPPPHLPAPAPPSPPPPPPPPSPASPHAPAPPPPPP